MLTAKEARYIRDHSETMKNTKEYFHKVIEEIEKFIRFAASNGDSEYEVTPGLEVHKLLHPTGMDINDEMLREMVTQTLFEAGYGVDTKCGNDYRERLVISWKEPDTIGECK